MEKPLSRAIAGYTPNPMYTYNIHTVGYYDPTQAPFDNSKEYTYHDLVKYCRFFYKRDSIVRTVLNRMKNLGITKLRNRKGKSDEQTLKYYDAVLKKIQPFIKHVALEYLLTGLVVPGLTYKTTMMSKIDPSLGRKRVEFPENLWIRNQSNIKLRRRPRGMERAVYLEIPQDEISFIVNKGKRTDGTDDTAAYKELLRESPAYVRAVQAGQRLFPLDDVKPIYGDLTSDSEYPVPYLQNALSPMQHKDYLKLMDRTIVSRSVEMVRQIKVGSDNFPATDDDLDATKRTLADAAASGDRVFNLFTNHTVEIEWVLPPLDALLNETKYLEPNADIFMALGFPRILTVGESLRSNSSDSRIASLGPLATLNEMRERILEWVEWLFEELAERNNFSTWPEPYFSPVQFQDMTALTQFAIQAQQIGAISKDTISQLYGSTYEEELDKIQFEVTNDESDERRPEAPEESIPSPGSGLLPSEE